MAPQAEGRPLQWTAAKLNARAISGSSGESWQAASVRLMMMFKRSTKVN